MTTRSITFRMSLLIAMFALIAISCSVIDNLTGGANEAESTAPDPDFPSGELIFVEDFNGSLPNWTDFIAGEGEDADTSIVNGQFIFDIQSEFTFAYTLYDGETYADVQLTTNVENRGHENNYITLVCRESADGWYELSIASDGFYSIDFADDATDSFENLAAGSTDTINLGAASNEFSAICQGDLLSLYVNGEFVDSATDSRLPEGHVGISAASLEDLPILVAFDYLEVSQP